MAKNQPKQGEPKAEEPSAAQASTDEPKSDAAQPEEVPATPAPEPSTNPPKESPRFRVWPHGALSYNGMLFQAGEELPLSEEEALAMRCDAVERF